jgi:ribosomal protein S18 acetylase RimI-like enzyme
MIIKLAETREELEQILTLQDKNHLENIPIDKRNTNGFVTVRHDIDLLLKMNKSASQIVAIENEIVVGYALVMLKDFSKMIPVLTPMFEMFEKLEFDKKLLSDYNYYVMGQICIKETHRGLGIFEKLYLKHKEIYATRFDICLTEVSTSNIRSMKAHEKVGFRTIHRYEDKSDNWNILLWDWN